MGESRPGIPPRVREFLLTHVDSIGLLEVLITLADAPGTALTPEQVSDHLRTSPVSARDRLRSLTERGLAEELPEGAFRLASGAELAATVCEASEAYRERRVSVIGLIYSRPSGALRGVPGR